MQTKADNKLYASVRIQKLVIIAKSICARIVKMVDLAKSKMTPMKLNASVLRHFMGNIANQVSVGYFYIFNYVIYLRVCSFITELREQKTNK